LLHNIHNHALDLWSALEKVKKVPAQSLVFSSFFDLFDLAVKFRETNLS
jgi:hypothetical protein